MGDNSVCQLTYKKEDMEWLQMRQISTRDQMNQKLTVVGHSTDSNT